MIPMHLGKVVANVDVDDLQRTQIMDDFEKSRTRIIEVASSDPNAALSLADELVAGNPNASAAWSVRSHVLWLLNRHVEALNDCDKAIEVEPTEPANYFHKGDYLLEIGKFNEAIDLFSKSIDFGRENDFDYYEKSSRMFRAFSYYKIGNKNMALNDLKFVDDGASIWAGSVISKEDLVEMCLGR